MDKSGFPEWARVVVHKKDPDTGDVYPNPARDKRDEEKERRAI